MGDDNRTFRPFRFGELDDRSTSQRGGAKAEEDAPFKQIYGPRMAAVAERLKGAALMEEVSIEEEPPPPDPEEIIREALAKAQGLIEAEKAKGRQEGFELGRAEGRAVLDEAATSLVDAARDMERFKFDLVEESRGQVIELVCEISQRIIGPLTEMQRDCVVNVVTHALSMLTERETVSIRINPEDLQLVLDVKGDVLAAVDGVRNLTFIDDAGVARGGCLVETESTAIDARIKTQLDELIRAVRHVK